MRQMTSPDRLLSESERRGDENTFLNPLQFPQRVEDGRRLKAVGVVRIGKGETDRRLLVDDERSWEWQFPGFITVVIGEMDAEALINGAHLFGQGIDKAELTGDLVPEIAQHFVFEEIL